MNDAADPSPPPIRVAFCITELEAGGAERCLAEIAARIDRKRFSPVVYSLAPRPAPGRPSVVDRIESAGVELHFLGTARRWQVWSAVHKLTTLLRRQRPQVVQSFLFHANIVGRIAARRAGVPHIVSGIRVAERRRRWYLWLDRWTAGCVDRHVCVSRSVADFSRSAGRLPEDRLLVIPNGIDMRRFESVQPADLAELGMIPAGQRAVIFVGRLDEQKRVDWLLRLSPRWMERNPQFDLLIVGDGPQGAYLRQLAEELGIGGRVHFAGWRNDVPELLAASDLLVLPSAWEGMPNVVLEAMASRLPVVATEVEGVGEALGPAGKTQSVPADAAEQFAQKISTILSNASLQSDLGQSNRDRIRSHFSLERMVEKYEQLYEMLVRE